MLAFLKRRWVLLSCVFVLLVCSMVDLWCKEFEDLSGKGDGASSWDGWWKVSWFGLQDGTLCGGHAFTAVLRNRATFDLGVHHPKFGELPVWTVKGGKGLEGESEIEIPLWIPLSAILGWLVIRELRFREKRAKATESISP